MSTEIEHCQKAEYFNITSISAVSQKKPPLERCGQSCIMLESGNTYSSVQHFSILCVINVVLMKTQENICIFMHKILSI